MNEVHLVPAEEHYQFCKICMFPNSFDYMLHTSGHLNLQAGAAVLQAEKMGQDTKIIVPKIKHWVIAQGVFYK